MKPTLMDLTKVGGDKTPLYPNVPWGLLIDRESSRWLDDVEGAWGMNVKYHLYAMHSVWKGSKNIPIQVCPTKAYYIWLSQSNYDGF